MDKKEIKSKEEFIDMYAGKIWSRHDLVDEKTGKYFDEHIPTLHKMYLGLERFIEAQDKWDTYQT